MLTLKKNLNDHVYKQLKEMIIKGELKPGEKLLEINLTALLDTSRTPIRDALRRLEKENLVTLVPFQSAEVTRLSKKTIINLYECRAVLEGLAARQAVEHIKIEEIEKLEESILLSEHYFVNGNLKKTVEKNTFFHEEIVNASKNLPLIQMMENLSTQILRYRILTSTLGFRDQFIDEHKEILEALKDKKADLAESLMKNHILNDLDNFLTELQTEYLEIEM